MTLYPTLGITAVDITISAYWKGLMIRNPAVKYVLCIKKQRSITMINSQACCCA